MRYKKFLIEAEDTFSYDKRPVNPNIGVDQKNDAIIKLLTTDYSAAYQKFKEGKSIWRGIKTRFDAQLFLASERQPRRSANTNNYYTLLIDNALPAWKNYPKRSTGLSCTNCKEDAEAYGRGHLYAVLPKNGSKVAVTPSHDFWFSFAGGKSYTIARVNQDIKFIYDKLGVNLSETDVNSLVNALKSYDVFDTTETIIKQQQPGYRMYEDFLSKCKNTFKFTGGTFFDLYKHILTPKGFKVTTIEGYNVPADNHEYSQEVWMDGDVLLVNSDVIKNIRIE